MSFRWNFTAPHQKPYTIFLRRPSTAETTNCLLSTDFFSPNSLAPPNTTLCCSFSTFIAYLYPFPTSDGIFTVPPTSPRTCIRTPARLARQCFPFLQAMFLHWHIYTFMGEMKMSWYFHNLWFGKCFFYFTIPAGVGFCLLQVVVVV